MTAVTTGRPAARPRAARPGQRRARRKEALYGLGFLAPQLFGLAAFMIGPLIFAIVLSFVEWDAFSPMLPVGLANFDWVLTDPQIRQSALNTVWFSVLQVPTLMIGGFVTAYFLQRAGRFKGFYRVLFFAPHITSSVAVAGIWLWLFNPEISPVSPVLRGVGIAPPNWLQDPQTVIIAFAIVGVWQGLGYQVIMFMAGLDNLPRSIMEAADIDGASELQKLVRITIPLLSPTILFLSVTTIIGSFQIFDYIYVFLGTSAPAAARTIVYEIVQVGFSEYAFGRASALAVCLLIALLVLTGLQLAAQRRWVHYTE